MLLEKRRGSLPLLFRDVLCAAMRFSDEGKKRLIGAFVGFLRVILHVVHSPFSPSCVRDHCRELVFNLLRVKVRLRPFEGFILRERVDVR